MQKIYRFETNNVTERSYGIDKNIDIGDKEKIKKFKNIRYDGLTTVKTNNEEIIVHKITFQNIEKRLEKIIFNNIEKWFEEVFSEHNFTTVYSLLIQISNYFKIQTKKELTNKLIGDIGEICAIRILQNNNIDYSKFYQNTANQVFDFFISKKSFLDVKTTTQNKKKILLNWKQIKDIDKAVFLIIEVSKKSKGENILNLIDGIKNKTDLILEIESFWQNTFMFDKELINSWTIDFEKINYYFLKKEAYPLINIKRDSSITNATIEISTAGFEDYEINKMFKKIFK